MNRIARVRYGTRRLGTALIVSIFLGACSAGGTGAEDQAGDLQSLETVLFSFSYPKTWTSTVVGPNAVRLEDPSGTTEVFVANAGEQPVGSVPEALLETFTRDAAFEYEASEPASIGDFGGVSTLGASLGTDGQSAMLAAVIIDGTGYQIIANGSQQDMEEDVASLQDVLNSFQPSSSSSTGSLSIWDLPTPDAGSLGDCRLQSFTEVNGELGGGSGQWQAGNACPTEAVRAYFGEAFPAAGWTHVEGPEWDARRETYVRNDLAATVTVLVTEEVAVVWICPPSDGCFEPD